MTSKDERLQIRVDARHKQMIEEAAEVSHLSVSSFVVQAASTAAEDLLAMRASIKLDRDTAERFLEVLHTPAAPNYDLADALNRPIKVDWLD